MELRSLGFATDLMVLRLAGSRIEGRGDRLVVRSDDPSHWWGNFVLFACPPARDEAASWLDTYAADLPDARHVAIGIDGTDGTTGHVGALLDAGCEVDAATVLTARELRPPPHPHPAAVCRALGFDGDWAQALQLWAATNDRHDDADYRDYAARRLCTFRSLQDAGHGAWFGAFVDGELQAALGIFTDGSGVARFQHVGTHPEHRAQGLAGTLVHHAGRYAFDVLGARTLVIVADPGHSAIRIYRALGFAGTQTQVQLQRAPARLR